MRNFFLIQFLCTLCLIAKFDYTYADIVSTFDADDEGWSVAEFPGPPYNTLANPTYSANYLNTGGNPGGAISATDQNGNLFLFSAPSAFLGNIEGFYGGNLSYDLRFVDSGLPPGFLHPDVVLWGNGVILTIDYFNDPATQTDLWDSYLIPLTNTAGWRFDNLSGTLASESEIRGVLADLTGLYIRGDYWNGIDQTDFDNPRLTVVPLPSAVLLLSTSVFGLVFIRRRQQGFT